MINKWILNNFKSINKEKELEFRPLTIFTGANSSGKSTILQSVLLVSQTLQSPIESRSIVLNGGIKKFGSYGDIVHRRLWKKDLTVGFDITNEKYASSRFYTPWGESVRGVSCVFSVGAKKEDDLQPYLKKLQLVSRGEKDKEASLVLSRIESLSEKAKKVVDMMKNTPSAEDLSYSVVHKTEEGFSRVHYSRENTQGYIGASLSHFLPQYLLSPYNVFEAMSELFFDRFYSGSYRLYNMLDSEMNHFLSEAMEDVCMQASLRLKELAAIHPRRKNKKKFEQAYNEYMQSKQFFTFVEMYRSCEIPISEKLPIADAIKTAMVNLTPVYDTERMSSHYIPGVDYLREFFSDHIWYLGPLREEPKAIYPLESDISMNEVGYKGENTAAVYEYSKKKEIDYISPAAFQDLSHIELKKSRGTLEQAIKEWLVYLGVASDIATDDQGKIGHTMQISNDLDLKQDLTHVGVGVSQVLPILVMSLLADEGDVLIMEQPELHLHPKVQARLADFFVSMNAMKRQCLVETHSEYLINRLRYLVVLSEDSKVANDTMLYFVEKDGGHSVYRKVTINEYGVIEDWPDGFFDEAQKISAAILEEGMKKRMKELGMEEDED